MDFTNSRNCFDFRPLMIFKPKPKRQCQQSALWVTYSTLYDGNCTMKKVMAIAKVDLLFEPVMSSMALWVHAYSHCYTCEISFVWHQFLFAISSGYSSWQTHKHTNTHTHIPVGNIITLLSQVIIIITEHHTLYQFTRCFNWQIHALLRWEWYST